MTDIYVACPHGNQKSYVTMYAYSDMFLAFRDFLLGKENIYAKRFTDFRITPIP